VTSLKSLHRLRGDLTPSEGARDRIFARVEEQMEAVPAVFADVRRSLQPSSTVRARVWERIGSATGQRLLPLIDRLRETLAPSADVFDTVREAVLSRLAPQPAFHVSALGKWAAAFVVVGLIIRMSPLLFLAPRTVADASVLLLPTRGSVSIFVDGTWQPLSEETPLAEDLIMKTDNGEATVVVRYDAVVRLDSDSIVELHWRGETASDLLLNLRRGRAWVQGLSPFHGVSIAMGDGTLSVGEGSVSIRRDQVSDIRVWDRRATVAHDGQNIFLVAGERTELWDGNVPVVMKMPDIEFTDPWVAQNLDRDAVHRSEIAELQKQRRVDMAGILPTSTLYPVKRLAETVSEIFALGEEAKAQEKLAQAQTRLSEAAALIAEGETDEAAAPLQEYRDTLIEVASGSGGDAIVQNLVREELMASAADFGAVSPADPTYVVKETVLQAGVDLPEHIVPEQQQVKGVLLLDALTDLHHAVKDGRIDEAKVTFEELQPSLVALRSGNDTLPPELRREAVALLNEVEATVEGETSPDAEETDTPDGRPARRPAQVVHLTPDQIYALVQEVRERILRYSQLQGQRNELLNALRKYQGHPDEGSILRMLYDQVPTDLTRYVRTALAQLRGKISEETMLHPAAGTGGIEDTIIEEETGS
jgi:hypothetical protein